jgi:hypothetical protein
VAHYGLLGNYKLGQGEDDIRGATLYGLQDEKLGKIDDVIFDHSTGEIQYAVVDTGGWLKTKKFIVPANRLRPSSEHKDDFAADLTKKEVEGFPNYEATDLDSENRWTDYDRRYRAQWKTNPVMHRAETDRNITPTTQQLEGNQASLRASGSTNRAVPITNVDRGESVDAATAPTERVVPAGSDDVVIANSGAGIGGRWDTFQARLRERRKEAVAACRFCAVGPATVKGSESAADIKKAV